MHFCGEREKPGEREGVKQRGVDGRFCETNTPRRAGRSMKKQRESEGAAKKARQLVL